MLRSRFLGIPIFPKIGCCWDLSTTALLRESGQCQSLIVDLTHIVLTSAKLVQEKRMPSTFESLAHPNTWPRRPSDLSRWTSARSWTSRRRIRGIPAKIKKDFSNSGVTQSCFRRERHWFESCLSESSVKCNFFISFVYYLQLYLWPNETIIEHQQQKSLP